MSRENVEIVRRCFEAGKRRDYSVLPDLTHADFVLDLSRNIFNPDTYRGVDGMRLFFERVDEMWEQLEASPEEIIEADDRAVIAVRMKGTGREGIQGEMLVFQVWEFREGKVARISGGFRDRDEALENAGLRE
jgi:ketosteroid isomerase-like protein